MDQETKEALAQLFAAQKKLAALDVIHSFRYAKDTRGQVHRRPGDLWIAGSERGMTPYDPLCPAQPGRMASRE